MTEATEEESTAGQAADASGRGVVVAFGQTMFSGAEGGQCVEVATAGVVCTSVTPRP